MQQQHELVIIGAGPAGLCAAASAWQCGCRYILILERDEAPGGILQQCIHTGFGLERFQAELTGPGYAQRCLEDLSGKAGIELMTDTMALEVQAGTDGPVIRAVSPMGTMEIRAMAVVLAMGCRERTRGALRIPGTRPAGIYTAGAAQYMVNRQGILPGHRAVILGSGDIGLIMARRLEVSGCEAAGVFEILPHSHGLRRNVVQCLEDFQIPLHLSETIVEIKGEQRITSVITAKVDEAQHPIPGSEREIPCDTLLLSVGLIPENELTQQAGARMDGRTRGPQIDAHCQTSLPGVFAAGNVVRVHDLADSVSSEADIAGASAAEYVCRQKEGERA